jgi:hypothetical protein
VHIHRRGGRDHRATLRLGADRDGVRSGRHYVIGRGARRGGARGDIGRGRLACEALR